MPTRLDPVTQDGPRWRGLQPQVVALFQREVAVSEDTRHVRLGRHPVAGDGDMVGLCGRLGLGHRDPQHNHVLADLDALGVQVQPLRRHRLHHAVHLLRGPVPAPVEQVFAVLLQRGETPFRVVEQGVGQQTVDKCVVVGHATVSGNGRHLHRLLFQLVTGSIAHPSRPIHHGQPIRVRSTPETSKRTAGFPGSGSTPARPTGRPTPD